MTGNWSHRQEKWWLLSFAVLSLSLAHFFRLTFPQWKRRTYTHLYTYQNQHNLRLKLFALYYPAICVSNEGMSQFSYFKWFEWKIWREIINDLWYKLFELVANKNLSIFIVFKARERWSFPLILYYLIKDVTTFQAKKRMAFGIRHHILLSNNHVAFPPIENVSFSTSFSLCL